MLTEQPRLVFLHFWAKDDGTLPHYADNVSHAPWRNAEPIAGVAKRTCRIKGTPSFSQVNSEKEHAMETKTFILASVAVFALGVGSATSGPCTTEIDGLAKTLAAKDAGSGPTPGASGRTSTAANPSSQHPPTAAMNQATQGQATSPEDVRRQTAGQPTAAQQGTTGTAAQHPPTAVMSEATQGQTAPAATSGQHPPTAAMSEATRSQAAPGPAALGNTSEASIALGRARELDQQGKEAECMDAVREANRLAGPL